ncbi:hypothetical protein C1N60_23340 (plasmid) [Pantoea sp. SGAir0184]
MSVNKIIKFIPCLLLMGFLITFVNAVDTTVNSGLIGKGEFIYESLKSGDSDVIVRAFFLASFQYGVFLWVGLYALVKIGKAVL